jgi:hypothetical protein
MRLAGTHDAARVSGIARALSRRTTLGNLAGTNAISVYSKYAKIVDEIFAAPFPTPTGTRPPDALIFSDAFGYLTQVLNNADWQGVARWYATRIQETLKDTTNPKAFWELSALNVQAHCDRTFTPGDLHAFTKLCILQLCIADYGNKVGFGYQGKSDSLNLAMFFMNGLSHNSGQLDWMQSAANAKAGTRYGMCIGWVKEPSKHTASRIIVAVGAAFIGAAAWSAISTAGAATSGATGAAIPAAGTTGGAIVGGGASVIPAGVEVVTTVASALPAVTVTAGTIGAGLAAGTIASVAAAPPISAPPPSAPAPVIETVTTTASAIAPAPITAGTIGAGLAAGTVAIVASAPPLMTEQPIETVTTEAPRIVEQHPVDIATAIGTGLVSVGIEQFVPSAPAPSDFEVQGDSLTDNIKNNLQDAAGEYGSQWLQDHLAEWLRDQLGREPTPDELDEYERYIPGAGLKTFVPWLILAGILAAVAYSTPDRSH